MTFDENGSVMHNGKPMADSIKEWVNTDEGKSFVVSTNSGGGDKPSAQKKPQPGSKENQSAEDILKSIEDGTFTGDSETNWH